MVNILTLMRMVRIKFIVVSSDRVALVHRGGRRCGASAVGHRVGFGAGAAVQQACRVVAGTVRPGTQRFTVACIRAVS